MFKPASRLTALMLCVLASAAEMPAQTSSSAAPWSSTPATGPTPPRSTTPPATTTPPTTTTPPATTKPPATTTPPATIPPITPLPPVPVPRPGRMVPATADFTLTTLPIGMGLEATNDIELADFDSDGDLDCVVANGFSFYGGGDRSNVLLNDGDGNLAFAENIGRVHSAMDFSLSAAVADFNGDGSLDIVLGNAGISFPSEVLFNDGAGGFAASTPCNLGSGLGIQTWDIQAGDLDNDGAVDIVMGNGSVSNGSQNYVFMNNNNGTFAAGVNLGAATDHTLALAIADYTGDGNLDVAVHNGPRSQNGAKIADGENQIFAGDGKGNLSLHQVFRAGDESSYGLASGDADGDGDDDLCLLACGDPATAINRLYFNDGHGMFGNPRDVGTGDDTMDARFADADGDGDLDLAVANYSASSSHKPTQLHLNDGQGNYTAGPVLGSGVGITMAVAAGDLNGDAIIDFALGQGAVLGGLPNYLVLGAGIDAEFSVRTSTVGTMIEETSSMAFADLNGDGRLDLVTGNANSFNFAILNDGEGHFILDRNTQLFDCRVNAQGDLRGNATRAIATGDLDNDNDIDIVVGNSDGHISRVYLNDGSGQMILAVNAGAAFATAEIYALALADFDGDGYLDIAAGVKNADSRIYFNNGSGVFSATDSAVFGVPAAVRALAAADFNDDGDMDIAIGVDGGQNAVYYNDGSGGFLKASTGGPAQISHFGTGSDATRSLAVADFDGDGALDIAVGNYYGQDAVYFGPNPLAPAPFAVELRIGAALTGTQSLAAGDMDGDHNPDLVAGLSAASDLIYFNDRIATGSGTLVKPFGVPFSMTDSLALGDADGDGTLDIVVAYYESLHMVCFNTPKDAPAVTTTYLDADWGRPFSATLSAAGGSGQFEWTAYGLPAWLAFDPATAVLSGTAGTPGDYRIIVVIRDTVTGYISNPTVLNIRVTGFVPLPIAGVIIATGGALPDAVSGSAYSTTLTAINNIGPIVWSSSQQLPAWLALDAATGVLSGTPPTLFTTTILTFDVTAADSVAAYTQTFSLIVLLAPITVTAILPPATAGTPFTATLVATGGCGAYDWSVSGAPSWLTLDTVTGVLTGTPRAGSQGSTSLTIIATDALNPPLMGSASAVLTVNAVTVPPSPQPKPADPTAAASAMCSHNRDAQTLPMMMALGLLALAVWRGSRRGRRREGGLEIGASDTCHGC